MARWVAIFEDGPEMAAVRRTHAEAHLGFLRENGDRILIAGGLREAPGGAFTGGLWVLHVDSREEAVRLIEKDPYYRQHRRPYRLLVWGKANEDRTVTL